MIDLKNTTFTIPVKIDNKERAQNLFISVSSLIKRFDTNIIISEQDTDYAGRILQGYGNRVEIIKFNSKYKNTIHRTKQLNEMANISQTKYIVNYDCDILLPDTQILESINKLEDGFDFVYPYDSRFLNIDNDKHLEIHNDISKLDCIDNKYYNEIYIQSGISLGGCVFFNKTSFFEGGGENENFIGWGPEDKERFYRFNLLGYNYARISGDIYHLKHPESSFTNPYWQNNEILYKEILEKYNTKEKMFGYINGFEWKKKI